jgi:CRISPR-associated protein (TIGR02710 family)
MADRCAVLLLTVGTGTRGREEETVLEPFRKSLEAAGAARNFLLPSQETRATAEKIRDTFPQFAIEIRPLPEAGDENNADRCFEHYDAVLAEVLDAGADPAEIIADITRGTKAMSAALLLAAAVRGVRRVRYLVGQQRNASGMAEPGTEVVSDIEPSFIFIRQTLLRAEELLRAGNFRAAALLLGPHQAGKGRPKHRFAQEAALLRWAARFWGAWDRFDYGTARRLLDAMPESAPAGFQNLLPTQAHRNLVITLAEGVPIPLGERVKHCRALAADLLANAERRLAEGRFEEVLVRVYRILELITTYRLFSHGIDAEQIDPGDPRLVEWQQTRKNSGEGRLRPSRALGRRNSAELLVFIEQRQPGSRGAMIAARLVSAKDWLGVNDAQLRNASILIHGLAGSSLAIAEKLPEILAALRDFFYEEHGRNRDLHEAARFPFLRQ